MNTNANKGRTQDMLFASGSPGSAAAWFRNDETLEAEQRKAKKDVVSRAAEKEPRLVEFSRNRTKFRWSRVRIHRGVNCLSHLACQPQLLKWISGAALVCFEDFAR